VFLVSIGATIFVLLACVVVFLDDPSQRRTVFSFFWGVPAGAGILVLLVMHALSQLGS
jgi:hypothetical protein